MAVTDDPVGDGVVKVFFDAPSDILLPLHDARPEICVCFDDNVAITVFEKLAKSIVAG